MLLAFFYPALGIRIQNQGAVGDYADLVGWEHDIYNPSGHVGLSIKHGSERRYISFSPRSTEGLKTTPFMQLGNGRPAVLTTNMKADKMLWGLRRCWNELRNNLTSEQLALTDNGSITHLSDHELHNLTLLFDENMLLDNGSPSFTIRLKTLDLAAMIKRIDSLTSQTGLWAFWSGAHWHEPKTYNCASIVLKVLYEGGMRDKVHSHAFYCSVMGLFLGFTALSMTRNPAFIFCGLVLGFISGRFAGGMMDGYQDIQPFLDLVANESKDDMGTLLGLRIASSLSVAFASLLRSGPIFADYFALPRHVESLAEEARHFDDSRHLFAPARRTRPGNQ